MKRRLLVLSLLGGLCVVEQCQAGGFQAGIGCYLPSDESFERYDGALLTLSCGGIFSVSPQFGIRPQFEYVNTDPGGAGPRFVEVGSSDLTSLGFRLSAIYYGAPMTENGIYGGAGFTYRRVTNRLHVRSSGPSIRAEEVTSDGSGSGFHCLAGVKYSAFFLEGLYEFVSVDSEFGAENLNGATITAGLSVFF